MRLFTAIDIPGETLSALSGFLDTLRPVGKLRWSRIENLHITTKFIGDWDEHRLPELITELSTVKAAAIPVRVDGVGWFPNPHHPSALFAVAAGEFGGLVSETNAACERLGIQPETRPFKPHVTLARVDSIAGVAEVRKAIATAGSLDFGQFAARSFALFESKMGPGRSIYTKLKEFPLP
jgi:RNA 2',3'-cyclic 3'-phosphodiesterase